MASHFQVQRCNDFGSPISSDDEEDYERQHVLKDNMLFRHYCVDSVTYVKGLEDSLAWNIYDDENGTTRCGVCKKIWPVKFITPPRNA